MPVLYRTLSAFRKAPMHRSLRFAVSTLKNRLRKPLCAALAIWVFPVAAQAPSVETLAAQADAVLVVEMAFVPYGDLVLTREILHGDKNSLPDASEFLGACLPGKAGVRQLANQVSGTAAQIYREAIERATYTAVLFLKREAGLLKPLCNESLCNPEHWETHPNHAAWRARVVSVLRARR